jgi:hypothetical protein
MPRTRPSPAYARESLLGKDRPTTRKILPYCHADDDLTVTTPTSKTSTAWSDLAAFSRWLVGNITRLFIGRSPLYCRSPQLGAYRIDETRGRRIRSGVVRGYRSLPIAVG